MAQWHSQIGSVWKELPTGKRESTSWSKKFEKIPTFPSKIENVLNLRELMTKILPKQDVRVPKFHDFFSIFESLRKRGSDLSHQRYDFEVERDLIRRKIEQWHKFWKQFQINSNILWKLRHNYWSSESRAKFFHKIIMEKQKIAIFRTFTTHFRPHEGRTPVSQCHCLRAYWEYEIHTADRFKFLGYAKQKNWYRKQKSFMIFCHKLIRDLFCQ